MKSLYKQLQLLSLAFKYALSGLVQTFKSEHAFRKELLVAFFALLFVPLVGNSPIEYILLASSLVLVLILELVNTAIESAVDLYTKQKHPLAKKAKDAASASVFLAIVNASIVWGVLIFKLLF